MGTTGQDGPSYENYYPNDASNPNHVVYREGIFVGYRGLQRNHVRPLFPFGFGLSYSTFSYTNLKVSPLQIRRGQSASADRLFELSLDVTNSGRRRAADVVQLYVAPNRRESRGLSAS
jgi:beta-glucosidase